MQEQQVSQLHLGESPSASQTKATQDRRSKELHFALFLKSPKTRNSTAMDGRLVLWVLMVTLSWGLMGTYAANATTTAGNTTSPVIPTAAPVTTAPMGMTNATTAPMGMTNPTTAGMGMTNATTAPMGMTNPTTAPIGMTNATTAPMGMTNPTTAPMGMTNATMAPMGMTNATTVPMGMTNATTAGMGMTNATTAGMGMTNATTAGMGMTNATTAGMGMTNATTAGMGMTNATTAAPSLISRADCGSRKLCAEEPSDCNPSDGTQCFFFAAVLKGNDSFEIELSGETNGYIASALSTDATRGGNDKTYMCANSNGEVKLFEALFDNNQLNSVNESSISVNGNARGGRIQCIFEAPVPTPTTRATVNTNFSVSVLTGDFNATSQQFGAPNPKIETNVVDLANPNATAINQLTTSTTSAPMTTAHGVTLQQPLIQALLVTVGVLVFSMLQGN
ncbi:uncharacterized protein ACNS7B_021543 [Menidia menidia]